VSAGQVLYGELYYWYGPVDPYLNALLFRIFGVRAGVLIVAGLCSAALMTMLTFMLACRFTRAFGAGVIATTFVYLCAFGHYYVNDIFNWATPYAYAATYGMLAATASLYGLVRFADGARVGWFVASLACLGVTALAKLEPTLPAVMAHVAFVLAAWFAGRPLRRFLPVYGLTALGIVAVVVVLTLRGGSGSYETSVLSQMNARNLGPVLRFMGVSEWRTALPAVAMSTLRLGLALVIPIVLSALVARPMAVWVSVAASAAGAFALTVGAEPTMALRGLPVLVVMGFGAVAWRFTTHRRERPRLVADVVLWAFAVGTLARVPLAAGAHHYGFYLIPVALTAFLLLWFRYAPAFRPDVPALRWCSSGAGVALAAGLCWTHAHAAREMYARHTVVVSTPRGEVRLLDAVGGIPAGEWYAATIDRLRAFPPDTTVMAVPDGVALAFFAGLPSWGPHYSYYPPEVGSERADARLRADLEADPPDLIVLLNFLDLGPYGALGFGRDYARASMAWMQQHYETDRVIGPNAIVIARRRGLSSP